MADTTRIEKIAVNYIEENILKCKHLDPAINSEDREPSWDGCIRIYNTDSKDKENMLGLVKVQVKGQTCIEFNQESISYSVDIADLKNYLQNGGVIFFVVQESPSDEKKAFYETLLPVKLQQYLDGVDANQHTKTIHLRPFPVNEPSRMETILTNFFIDAQRQASFANASLMSPEDLKNNKNIEQISFSTTTFYSPDANKADPLAPFFENEVFFYAKIKGSSISEPIRCTPKSISFISNTQSKIAVGDETYYPNCTIIRTKDILKIQWGPGFSLIMPGNGKNNTFNYQCPNLLSQRLLNQRFLCALGKYKSFRIGHVDIPCHELVELADPQRKKDLETLERVQKLLLEMHVTDDLDFSKITPSQSKSLHLLIQSIIDKQPIANVNVCKDTPICTDVSIGNLSLKVIIAPSKIESGKYDIRDFFAQKEWVIAYSTENSNTYYRMPRAALLKEEDFLHLSNIDYDYIIEEYEEIAPSNSQIYLMANETLNILLTAYDKKHKNIYLDSASRIADLMIKGDTPWFTFADKMLDILQIAKRKRRLSAEEEDVLYRITSDKDATNFCKLGAYLLLGDKKMAKRIYKQLNIEEQEVFNESPMHRFWK